MANYNKNIFVGTGGVRGINESHYIGAVYGMERIMGVGDTPLRRILNYAQDHFCQHLPLLYVLTVIGPNDARQVGRPRPVHRRRRRVLLAGLRPGVRGERHRRADEPFQKCVVYLDPEKFHSTWLGNKAIYRTRMAMADDGELVILAPGVRTFGEDPEIDRLIRKYGYLTTPEMLAAVARQRRPARATSRPRPTSSTARAKGDSASPTARATCSREEIETAKLRVRRPRRVLRAVRRRRSSATAGTTCADGERVFFVRDPAMGLWKRKLRRATHRVRWCKTEFRPRPPSPLARDTARHWHCTRSCPIRKEPPHGNQTRGSQPSGKGPADWFTGAVRIDPLFDAPEPARVVGASVTFEPGARTAWHTHPLGQTLIVTAGCGWAQREGGPVEEIRPGDVVWFPPGEKHWHGATATTAMTHIAIQEKLDGKAVDWMETGQRRAIPAITVRAIPDDAHIDPQENQCKSANSETAAWKSRPSASAAWG